MTINNKTDETREVLKMDMSIQDVVAKLYSAVMYATTHADLDQTEKKQLVDALEISTAVLRRSGAVERSEPLTEDDLLRMDGCAVWVSGMDVWAEVSHADRLVLTCVDDGMQIRGFEKFLGSCPLYRRRPVLPTICKEA